ncbi:MAG: SMC-Scp complex subunit ScpB [Deltaproteobacteria bacterium]|nr:SMC-Scp complex subunit ScpB [Deltaproteobacteria bacterium]MBW2394251.1 SMC-Scp complex subunit ScpB [Deltaproteobacteria bacterium]
MDRQQQKQIVEALILASPEPVSAQRLAQIVPYLKPAKAKELVAELGEEYKEQERAFEVWEVAGGYQIRTRPDFSGYLRALHAERPLRLSRAALETLSVIAYKQPVTRAEVEHVRGVDAGATVKSLVDRKLVRIAGHREVPGRPMLYATTKRFLEVFGLPKLDDLPTLREIEELLPPADPDVEIEAAEAGHERDEEAAGSSEEASAEAAVETPLPPAEPSVAVPPTSELH